ncbi:MAG: tRNA preQ1(34) S-adenosylmethionine ribosyltransferase-isomerase QueA [Endozoicomonadaceae bacterium]|nr:tRNA preQ1(34) S-adenosylmethionine ribosyltransferase-isomerase QueA [Endozoicomonadaceae bacterium]
MLVSDFDFALPDHLIARYPVAERTGSRLMVAEGSSGNIFHHATFRHIVDYVRAGDLLVMNDTKVIPARLFGNKMTGGKVEVLIERILDERSALVHIRSGKSPKAGTELILENKITATVTGRKGELFCLKFTADRSVLSLLRDYGHIPLPPYLSRQDESADRERYQTVYAKREGAVAAPTAGLHFDNNLLMQLKEKGVNIACVTLHVGAGTFQPVRVNRVEDHTMHSEYIEVSESLCEAVQATKKRGNRIIAVGTTSVRCLESAGKSGKLLPFQGETDIFIYPGYVFQNVDLLITNFHLPQSTLLMLVAAFVGQSTMRAAYQAAIEREYRFFSYGDAMLISRQGLPLI